MRMMITLPDEGLSRVGSLPFAAGDAYFWVQEYIATTPLHKRIEEGG